MSQTDSIPPHLQWLGAEKLAEMLDFKPRYVSEKLAKRPEFPRPVRIDGIGHPRWNVAEVQAWMQQHRETDLCGRSDGSSHAVAECADLTAPCVEHVTSPKSYAWP